MTDFKAIMHQIRFRLWLHYSGPQELGGPGSLNRLNPRFLRHWSPHISLIFTKSYPDVHISIDFPRGPGVNHFDDDDDTDDEGNKRGTDSIYQISSLAIAINVIRRN